MITPLSGLALVLMAALGSAQVAPVAQPSSAIPFDQLGTAAQKQYAGDGISITPTAEGARLRVVSQKLEGQATREGLWLTSTAEEDADKGEKFRVLATAIGRQDPKSSFILHPSSFPPTGTVQATAEAATFTRPGVVEEYCVGMDGVRQDFVILERPAGAGELVVELALGGATAETASYGAKLTLAGSGRAIAYSRLRVTDATGRELSASLNVPAADRLTVRVDDTTAAYPVRIDPTFSDADWVSLNPGIPGVNGTVLAIAVDGSGNVYVGGGFSFVGNVTAKNIAKWNGSAWSALGSGMNFSVRSLVVSGSDLYAGGSFTTAGGVAASYIAKWNGSAWSALGSGMSGGSVSPSVYALAVSGSDLYVGGDFTSAGGVLANHIAKWNGSAWSALGSGTSGDGTFGIVYALAVSGSDLYAGGDFATAGGVSARRIAKWDGSAWSALGSGMSGGRTFTVVNALAVSGSDLYAGGDFYYAAGVIVNRIAKWNGSAWSALGSGVNGDITSVYALAVSGSDLFVGGDYFTTAGGVSAKRVAKWNGSAWSALGSGVTNAPEFNSPFGGSSVYALAASGSNLYVGGDFTRAGVPGVKSIAKWNGSGWSQLGPGMNIPVNALAVSGSGLFVGGSFISAGGVSAVNCIAKWNGTAWSLLGSGMNSTVNALAVSGSDLYAGGNFGSPAGRIAKWNGSAWSALGSGMGGGPVNALAVVGPDLYAGGEFTTAGGVSASYIAKWNGSAWSALGSGMNSTVNALAVSGSDLYAGGFFSTAGGVSASRIAKWNGSAWSALGSGIAGSVYALAVSGSDLYVGGSFSTAGGVTVNHIAKWNGSAWSALGSGMNSQVYALAVSGSDLYVGGVFNMAGGVSANRIAKWDGNAWSALGTGTDGAVNVLATATSGHLFVGGNFMFAGTTVSPYIAQANIGVAAGPEIAVEQPAGTDLTSGMASIAFGTVTLGSSSASKVFTIKNPGTSALTLTSVGATGGNAGDFPVNSAGMLTSVPANGSTTFSVTFTPTAAGDRATTLRILNDDSNEGTFDIALTGTALTPIQAWKLASLGDANAPDLDDPDGDGLQTLAEYGLVLPPNAPSQSPVVSRFTYGDGERLRMILSRDPAHNDVTIEVRAADSPAGPWTSVATSTLGAPFAGPGYVGGDNASPGVKTVEVRDTVNLLDAPRRFLRVRVTH